MKSLRRHLIPKEHAFVPVILLVIISVAGPEVGWGQERSRLRFLRWAYQDVGAFVQEVRAQAPLAVFGGALVLVPTASFDPALLEDVQERYRGPLASYLRVTNELGARYMPSVAAGVFVASLFTEDERFQDAAFTSFQSLVYAGALTGALKQIVGRHRPEAGSGAYRFVPFSGNTSFPSGHTTAAFAFLTPWVLYYPNAATYGLFALSAGTAVARVALDKHWPTDVLAGAAIGFLTARHLTKRHLLEAPQMTALTFRPLVTPEAVGLTLRLTV